MLSLENPHTDPDRDPLEVTEVEELICPGCSPSANFSKESYGKWIVFKDFSELSDTWRALRQSVRSGYLSKAIGAKCSTLRYNPLRAGAGPTTIGKISIFTSESDAMDVGMQLIKLPSVQQVIKYKTQSATHAMKYRYTGPSNQPVSIGTLYWNEGKPSSERARRCFQKRPRDYDPLKDQWKINVVTGASQYASAKVHGKWTVPSNFDKGSNYNISKLWHAMKPKVEGGDIPAVKMVCPGPRRVSKVHVFTSEENMDVVGRSILSWLKDNGYTDDSITYYIEIGGRSRRNDHKTLYWNVGKPDYVKA